MYVQSSSTPFSEHFWLLPTRTPDTIPNTAAWISGRCCGQYIVAHWHPDKYNHSKRLSAGGLESVINWEAAAFCLVGHQEIEDGWIRAYLAL